MRAGQPRCRKFTYTARHTAVRTGPCAQMRRMKKIGDEIWEADMHKLHLSKLEQE